jgi:predicted hotdog family 3-hydroxylacyl-ACP dehydratase
MAGGGVGAKVTPHDISIIVGAIGLIGTFVISMFAQPMIIEFGEVSSTQQVRSISVGVLGSNDDIVVHASPVCENNSTCTINNIKVMDEDGSELIRVSDFELAEDGSFSSSIEVDGGGELMIEINGQGTWEIKVTAQRQIPIQFLPTIASFLLLVWGVWRKFQEGPEDSDIAEIVESA